MLRGILWVPLAPERLLVRLAPVVLWVLGSSPGTAAWKIAAWIAAWKPAVTWASVICLGCAVAATAVAVLAIIFRVSSGTWETIVAVAAAITWKTVVSGVSAWSALFYIIVSIHSVGKIKIHNYLSLFYCAEGALPPGRFSMCSK